MRKLFLLLVGGTLFFASTAQDTAAIYLKLQEIAIIDQKVKALILFPDTGERIWHEVTKLLAVTDQPLSIAHHFTTSMTEAVRLAKQHAETGDIVMMSPASASFNHFKDYRDRGDQFKAAVTRL